MASESTLQPYTRHNEILVLDKWPGDVNANYFNQAQIVLKRSDKPIRFKIPTLNHLDLIVQTDAWIVVDRVLNDMPVVVWTNFQTEARDNLHEAIPCEIRIYHFAARMIFNTTLNAMDDILGQPVSNQDADDNTAVLLFDKSNKFYT